MVLSTKFLLESKINNSALWKMSKDGVPRETFTLTFDSNSERLFLKNVERFKSQSFVFRDFFPFFVIACSKPEKKCLNYHFLGD